MNHGLHLGNTYAWCTCGEWESNDPVRVRTQHAVHVSRANEDERESAVIVDITKTVALAQIQDRINRMSEDVEQATTRYAVRQEVPHGYNQDR